MHIPHFVASDIFDSAPVLYADEALRLVHRGFTMPIMEIGHVIKTLRNARQINQTALAAELGDDYNQSNISRIERGAQTLDLNQLFIIARALDVAPSDILKLAETPTDDSRWRRYLSLYAKLSDRQIDAILGLAEDA
jgi:transcriptional regulator with XRE-family HTH domain